MAGWVRLRGALQVPLRGPAQPLAAVRSGACEAVLRKQSALTHVSSVAASMRLTPPQPDPPRLRQISAICSRSAPCVDESPSESNISNWIPKASTHGVDLPCRPRSTLTRSRRNSSEAGRCRSAGCQPHGPEACLGRVGQDAQPRSCRVRRKAHTSKRLPSLQGRTCGVPALRYHPAFPRNARV
ncbi:unnamed protein product [Stenotrophomonas maltophilia]|nr:unnamed protein product [Stenotrophomonas maltophilia]